jgi:hypothetical protein
MNLPLTRHETADMQERHRGLVESPSAVQAEAIARHYLAQMQTARDLLEMVEMRRGAADRAQVDRCIVWAVESIQINHRCDFGIELAWRKDSCAG